MGIAAKKYQKETGFDPYVWLDGAIVDKTNQYIHWLEEQVKNNVDLSDVVNRRELLLDFANYSESDKTSQTTDECVDNYLDSIIT